MSRLPYWNITNGIIIDILALPVLLIFSYGFYRHLKRIYKGENLSIKEIVSYFDYSTTINFLKNFLKKGIFNRKLFKKIFSGINHGLVFWGMTILFVGTILVLFNILFGLPIFSGGFNVWFMSFTLDAAGLAVSVGVIFLALKRCLFPRRLKLPQSRSAFLVVESWVLLIIVTGFMVEALRITNSNFEPGSFLGNMISTFFMGFEDKRFLHQLFWWLHGTVSLAFIAYIPFSPLSHLLLTPTNAAFADDRPGNKMKLIDFTLLEDETNDMPPLGVSKLYDFDSKALLDFSSCLWCGRCHEVCPATQSGKALSPKGIVIELSKLLNEKKYNADIFQNPLISPEILYQCTTCAACIEACPAFIKPMKAIFSLRQYLAMEKAKLPDILNQAHKCLEARKHPFFGNAIGPNDWNIGLDVPIYKKNKTKFLLWIGCAIAYEEKNHVIARSMVDILKKANVSFGILESPQCIGDPARQMGNDFLFYEIASQNIERFSELGINKIITLCPHCYDSLVNYYPQLGGKYDVQHYSETLYRLIDTKQIQVNKTKTTFTYHDPCYLGRHNNIYEYPREVIRTIGKLKEMKRSKELSFCCGGGGGGFWSEEVGTRINQIRAQEAFDTDVSEIVTVCPYCILMLKDGIQKYTSQEKVKDLAEIVKINLKAS